MSDSAIITSKRVAKIRVKEGEVKITLVQKYGDQTEAETLFKSTEPPHEDLTAALNDLGVFVRKILELPDDWKLGDIKVSGVSWSMSDESEIEGATIVGSVPLSTAKSPFGFVTPHLPYERYGESNEPTMPDDAQAALDKVKRESEAFMAGKRAQGDLFAGAAAS